MALSYSLRGIFRCKSKRILSVHQSSGYSDRAEGLPICQQNDRKCYAETACHYNVQNLAYCTELKLG